VAFLGKINSRLGYLAIIIRTKFDDSSFNFFPTYRAKIHTNMRTQTHGRRNRGVWGTMFPHFWDQRGTGGRGEGGPMKMIFASTADSLYSVLYK